MGFGSYDESEQQQQEVNTDDDGEGVTVHEKTHDGTMTFESDASTTDLVDRLQEMKDDSDE